MGVPAIGVPPVGSVTRGEAAAPLSSLAFCAAMAAATNLERNGAPPDEVVVAVTPPRLGSSLSKDLCCERHVPSKVYWKNVIYIFKNLKLFKIC